MHRGRGLAAALCLTAVFAGGCTGTPTDVDPVPVVVRPAPGWEVVAPDGPAMAASAGTVLSAPARELIRHYAGAAAASGSVGGVVVTASKQGVAIVRREGEVDVPLAELARRTADDASEVGAPTSVVPIRIGDVDGWRLVSPADELGTVRTRILLDRAGRWVVDVLAPPAEIDQVVAAVSLA